MSRYNYHDYRGVDKKYWPLLKMIDKLTKSMVLSKELIKPKDYQGITYLYETLHYEIAKDRHDFYSNQRRKQVPY